MNDTTLTMNPPLNVTVRRHLLLAALALALVWLFRDTASAMVGIWMVSATFTHAFLVPPIVAWLVWRQRAALAQAPVRPAPWVLLPVAAACFMWLLADLAEVGAASQFAFVAVLVLLVPALYGVAYARVITFPLLFLFFAVPIGEFAVPTLQDWTADVTVMALRASGIPVYRDGHQFIIPTGVWSVIEACSGVRYLIACVMVGTLFAYLNYRSMRRRWVFIALSVVVPILANWIRAYTIVMIGHHTGSPMIFGVDHTVYGWYLFGAVVLALFFVGARWTEPDEALPPGRVPGGAAAQGGRAWPVALGLLTLAATTQGWAWHLASADPMPAPRLSLPGGQSGWTADAPGAAGLPWRPAYLNPNATFERSYVLDGKSVTVWIAYYRQQGPARKLVSSMNHIVDPEDTRWAYQAAAPAGPVSGLPAFRQGVVRLGAAPTLGDTQRFRSWHLMWVGGRWTVSPIAAKVGQALDSLLGRGDDGAVVLLTTPLADDADATLAKFAGAHLELVDGMLSAARLNREK